MTYFRDLSEDARTRWQNASETIINRRFKDVAAANDRITRYLAFANGGGVVSTLGFIASAQTLGPRPTFALLAAGAFALGLAGNGLWLIYDARMTSKDLGLALRNLRRARENEIPLKEIKTPGRASRIRWMRYVIWFSYGMFVVGLIFGASALWPQI